MPFHFAKTRVHFAPLDLSIEIVEKLEGQQELSQATQERFEQKEEETHKPLFDIIYEQIPTEEPMKPFVNVKEMKSTFNPKMTGTVSFTYSFQHIHSKQV